MRPSQLPWRSSATTTSALQIRRAMTEFTVAVYRNPTEHKIRLGQVLKWSQHTIKEGPAGITKREKVSALLVEG
jgi:hypothetical protein